MPHATPDKGLQMGKSLIQIMAEARQKQIAENEATLPAKMRSQDAPEGSEPAADPRLEGRVFAPRPMGILDPGVPALGQGKDRMGRPIQTPRVADLREHLPRGDEQ